MPLCAACGKEEPRSSFSPPQLKKAEARRCKACVDDGAVNLLADEGVTSTSNTASGYPQAPPLLVAESKAKGKSAGASPSAGSDDPLWIELQERGVVIIENVYSAEQIRTFKKKHDQLFASVQKQMKKQKPEERTYVNKFKGKVTLDKVDTYDVDGEEVIKIAEGRYDFSNGMDEGCFGKSNFHEPPALLNLMRKGLMHDYTHYAGALPSQSKSNPGPWHRDTYAMFDDSDAIVVTLPPFYYTVLIPLTELTKENGATEIIIGSHKKPSDTCEEGERFHACCKPGSIVVFDGRCCHRGGPNSSDEERTLLYMVWHKYWYNDYGTLENNFDWGSYREPT